MVVVSRENIITKIALTSYNATTWSSGRVVDRDGLEKLCEKQLPT